MTEQQNAWHTQHASSNSEMQPRKKKSKKQQVYCSTGVEGATLERTPARGSKRTRNMLRLALLNGANLVLARPVQLLARPRHSVLIQRLQLPRVALKFEPQVRNGAVMF
jgi:hypothetical protein